MRLQLNLTEDNVEKTHSYEVVLVRVVETRAQTEEERITELGQNTAYSLFVLYMALDSSHNHFGLLDYFDSMNRRRGFMLSNEDISKATGSYLLTYDEVLKTYRRKWCR